jgi:predicted Zn-dependent protease with MMP-like domain
MTPNFTHAPTLDDLAEIAEKALAEIPAELKRHIQGVALRIDEFPDDETLDELGIESPFDLLGLYRGVHLGHKTTGMIAHDVDMIFLYRRPILDEWCASGEPLPALIRHVLIHEIGHHFGLSDADMARIEATGTR